MIDSTAPHTRIDNVIIDERAGEIGAYGLAIYTVIKRHLNWTTGQCNPSYNRIAKILKINRRTVIRYVKRLKDRGLISAALQFTDEGQTSNQYDFYQPKRPKPAQTRTAEQKSNSSDRKCTPLVTEGHPPGEAESPEQVSSNKCKRTIKETADIDISISLSQGTEKPVASTQAPEKPGASEKTAPTVKTEKQKNCPHPFAEVIVLTDGITICNHCFDLIKLPEAEAA